MPPLPKLSAGSSLPVVFVSHSHRFPIANSSGLENRAGGNASWTSTASRRERVQAVPSGLRCRRRPGAPRWQAHGTLNWDSRARIMGQQLASLRAEVHTLLPPAVVPAKPALHYRRLSSPQKLSEEHLPFAAIPSVLCRERGGHDEVVERCGNTYIHTYADVDDRAPCRKGCRIKKAPRGAGCQMAWRGEKENNHR